MAVLTLHWAPAFWFGAGLGRVAGWKHCAGFCLQCWWPSGVILTYRAFVLVLSNSLSREELLGLFGPSPAQPSPALCLTPNSLESEPHELEPANRLFQLQA